jgi:voltage-gated potassium channel
MKKNTLGEWRNEGFLGVFLGVIAIFFVVPLFARSHYAHIVLQLGFTVLILATIYTMSRNQFVLIAGVAMVAIFLLLDLLSHIYQSLPLLIAGYGVYALFTLLAISILAKKLFLAPVIDTNLIFGALTVYLMSGILWAKIYFIEAALFPQSFHGPEILQAATVTFHDAYEIQFNLLYFSFATLATLGMGDITPLHHLAKSLTALEAMTGQLFVATVIAKVVSVWKNAPS